MGFINDLKKIFFGVESVSKSAADKATNKGKEVADDLRESTEELREKGKEALEKSREKLEDLGKRVESGSQKVTDRIEDLGEDVLEKGEQIWEKTKNISEDIGERIVHGKKEDTPTTGEADENFPSDKASEFVEKAGRKVEDIGRKVKEKGEEFADKAKEVLDNPEESVDKVMDKADELAKKLKDRVTTDADDLSDTTLQDKMKEHSGSELDDKDDFFSKAERFAEGEHHVFDVDADKPRIIETGEDQSSTEKKQKPEAKIPGFEDLDGDGDELIDDAEIVNEEE